MTQSIVLTAPEIYGQHRNRLGESPIWDAAAGRLLWCDILAGEILSADEDGNDLKRWAFPDKVGSFGLCHSGRWIVALAHGVHLFDPETNDLKLLVDPEPMPKTNRLNDGKVGPDGAFWIGSMDDRPQREALGALYRVTADGTAEKKVSDLIVSNGLAWSDDGKTMFHSDSRGQWIDAHDFDVTTGTLSNRRRIATPSEAAGRPDGGAVDVEGCYWSAGISAGCLNRYDPSGSLLERIELPMPAGTMPCFGGVDLQTLFVTSIGEGLAADLAAHPLAGRMAKMRVGVAGARVHRFKDR